VPSAAGARRRTPHRIRGIVSCVEYNAARKDSRVRSKLRAGIDGVWNAEAR
jgi:hypothetical protein